jgi:haloalkane dehalogenase
MTRAAAVRLVGPADLFASTGELAIDTSFNRAIRTPLDATSWIELVPSWLSRSEDIVANDSGGAVAQLLAARRPKRVRTLLLTNCDVHTDSPPKAMAPELEAARKGVLADPLARQISDNAFARSAEGVGGVCFTDPAKLTDEAIDTYFQPLVSSPARRAQLHQYVLTLEPNPLPTIEPALKACAAPARMVRGTGDRYFDSSWADWLDRTLPRSRGVRRVQGAKLFFPEEMPELIAEEASALWEVRP